MMRIAHVISTPEGFAGAERVLSAIVTHGSALGIPQLVCNPFARDPHSELAERTGSELYVPLQANGLAGLASVRSRLQATLKSFEPTIVHAHLFHAEVLVATLPRTGRWSRVLTHHHGSVFVGQGAGLRVALDRLALRRYDAVVGVSDAVSRSVQRWAPHANVLTIPNGWEGAPLPHAPDEHPTIVAVAAFRPEKGHPVLLRAFRQVLGDLPAARLILVGDGPTRPDAERISAELGIAESVRFLGAVQDVWPWYQRAHVAVVPSLTEPFGIVAAEAMAAGLPVVASRVEGLPEVVDDGETGLLVDPADADGLATALTLLLSDPARSEQLGRAGRSRAAELRLSTTVQRYYALYGDLTQDPSGWAP